MLYGLTRLGSRVTSLGSISSRTVNSFLGRSSLLHPPLLAPVPGDDHQPVLDVLGVDDGEVLAVPADGLQVPQLGALLRVVVVRLTLLQHLVLNRIKVISGINLAHFGQFGRSFIPRSKTHMLILVSNIIIIILIFKRDAGNFFLKYIEQNRLS